MNHDNDNGEKKIYSFHPNYMVDILTVLPL